MVKRKRIVLFSLLAVLSLIIATAIILYSFGFRFNFETKKVSQTGAFYFKIWPKSAEIYLDGKLKKKTDFLVGSALIENLLPQEYSVEIKKTGYLSWQKKLAVKKSEVTDAKNIILVPQNPIFNILSGNVKDYFVLSGEKKFILLQKNGEGTSLQLFDFEKNIKTQLLKQEDILKAAKTNFKVPLVEILDLNFSPDAKTAVLKVKINDDLKYFLLDLKKEAAALSLLNFLDENVKNISFNPTNFQKIFFLKNGVFLEGDLAKKTASPAPLKNIINYQINGGNIYYFDESGFLFKTDFSFVPGERINRIYFPVKNGAEYKLYFFENKIFLKEDGTAFLLNLESQYFEKFSEGIRNIEVSPDSKKIAYFSDYEIRLYFLKEEFSRPQRLPGDDVFIARFSEKIDDIFWYTAHYLIFNSGNNIKIAEIDDRDRLNIVDFADFRNPKIFWSGKNKTLYILSEGNLFSSEKLLP